MYIDHSNEKLIQTIVFFAKNVNKLGKVKLYKLLYFVDFMHFKEVGRSVTGLEYSAWKMGPVPVPLHARLDTLDPDWPGKIEFKKISISTGPMLTVRAACDFDPSHFSRRELRILESLATEFRSSTSDEMIEKTHLENSPWHKVWEIEKRRQQVIPYQYALRAQDSVAISELSRDRADLLAAFNAV